MDRIEPYIGMPIVLGDGGMQMSDDTQSRAMPQAQMQEGRMNQSQPQTGQMMQREGQNMRETQMQEGRSAQPMQQSPQQESRMMQQSGQSSQPVRPMPLPEFPDSQNCQPCLKDENCEMCHEAPQQVMMPAMAYVPWQRWQQPYDYETGFQAGTIFPDLDLPFLGYQGGGRR